MRKYHKINRAFFWGAEVCVFISNSFAVVLQFIKGDVLDYAVAGNLQNTIRYAFVLFCLILCEVLFYFLYRQFEARYVTECTKYLKHDIFDSILHRNYYEYKQCQQGEYISKYTNEADAIRRRMFEMLPLLGEILFKILLVSAGLFLLNWKIAFITLALLTTPLYIPKLIEKPLQQAQKEYLSALENNISKLNDWLFGFEIIKNFSVESKILTLFDDTNNVSMVKLRRDKQLGAVSQLITTLISYISYFIVLLCAAYRVLMGDFSAGDFFVAIGMIDQLSYPLISLAEIIRQLLAIRPACVAMEKFVDISDTSSAERTITAFRDVILFNDVTFAYPGQPDILRNFNLSIRKGERWLLQGPSGCGKTTTINLLLRYFQANSGQITIDGIPLADVGSTYGCITVVRQEAVLFHDTLRNNLTMYREIPDEKLLQILQNLSLDKFANISALDSIISENGANLSGGEKKRICLARALLRDTEILILDEPLANLDETTAGKIEDLLLSITDKTVLVVSHQFSESKRSGFQHILDFSQPL